MQCAKFARCLKLAMMIRFLDFKDQIIEGEESFAFYCTITDSILKFNGEQVFDSLQDFREYYALNAIVESPFKKMPPIERFTSLIPNRFFIKNSQQ